MPTRSSTAQWSGNLARGSGTMSLGSGAFEGSYSRSELTTEVKVDGLDDGEFQNYADAARSGCAVSRALGGVEISLDAKLA
jgi:osmotically inducible protein OsmC